MGKADYDILLGRRGARRSIGLPPAITCGPVAHDPACGLSAPDDFAGTNVR